ncbi:hypothetical protein TNCV_1573391 [Trichonephila clavipes]|uniref:Uncharacterized protein n=1 Tax=Trichonephila clavipes TaxID=2585209 RepID=A0A8X6SZA6_TRICX|nr:hypothetical protein TNCV_1573391 [Trichonephila clavipes]
MAFHPLPYKWGSLSGQRCTESLDWTNESDCVPDLTPLDFYLRGYFKNVVYSKKPHALEKLSYGIEKANTIAVATLRDVTNNVRHRDQKCLNADTLQFEHLL